MRVDQRRMKVSVGVGFASIPWEVVGMVMMLIMRMRMRMFLTLVRMQMPMPLSDMQPDPSGHQHSGDDELPRHGLTLQQDREPSTEEGSHGEICSSPGASKMAKCEHKEHQANPVT